MKVLVTGGTGFVGAWTAKAAQQAGRQVRFLVRNPDRLTTSAEKIGVDISDHIVGDIADAAATAAALDGCDAVIHCAAKVYTPHPFGGDTADAAATAAALDGCDAVIHCAAMVSTDPSRADEMLHTNLEGARNVLGEAARVGIDPIVHVSSFTALFRPDLDVLHADLPVVGGSDGYGRSKAAVEAYARGLQDGGAPVNITYPGMVLGPPAGDQFGEAAEGVEASVKMRGVPGRSAAWIVIDVRDLADLHVALLEPGRGPRRYMAGGQRVPVDTLAAMIGTAAGRSLAVYPVPDVALRSAGRLLDVVGPFLPFETPINSAAMQYYTQMPESDDTPSRRDLGINQRDPAETIADTVEGLRQVGRL